ncbi:MAG: nitrogen regulation protein NR(I) [Betaproteobacteria bacterium]|nr:nitrogen regulation protein NR(I) [Betaproteobacteria bacterium]
MDAVWVVDDDQSIRWVLERALSKEGYSVKAYSDAREALSAFDLAIAPGGNPPQAIISDVRMPGQSGVQMLARMKARRPALPVIIMTAFTDLDTAVQAFQSGAFEYLPKPFDLSQALDLIRRAVAEGKREAAVEEILTEAPDMLGQAPAMQEVFRAIGRLSQSSVTVLVTGESGTGKELVARALHRHSPRANKPFVALNTAAIPRDLLESELFGHERGAFTGAQAMRRGRFEQAEGGTLFLDEIGDMPPELQTRLLRVLSDGHFYRVGGHSPLRADVRVIAATHQALEARVRQGLFREDLFHRLNVIRLRLPALRERPEDVPLLARHFLSTSSRSLGTDPKRLTDAAAAVNLLARFGWPGNVRQLENVCHWLNVMAPAQTVDVGDLPPEIRELLTDDAHGRELVAAQVNGFHEEGIRAGAGIGESLVSEIHAELGNDDRSKNGVSGHPVLVGSDAGSDAGSGSVTGPGRWGIQLEREVDSLLNAQCSEGDPPEHSDLMDRLVREFETTLLTTALRHTRGRRIEAAQRLGIGRNTITRKIKELGIED